MATVDEKRGDVPTDTEKGMDLSPKATLGEGDILILKHADLNDADEAMKAFEGIEADSIVMTPEIERKLLWKIDRNIMPV
jgi:ACS family allantoate permease-like MFS transporter